MSAHFQIMLQADGETSTILTVLIAVSSAIYLIPKWFNSQTYQLKHIPTVGGSSGIIWSYFCAFRFYFHGHTMIQEGYDKYYGSAFKIPTMSGWRVIISGKMIDDVRRATDKSMTLHAALPEIFQTPYTIGLSILDDPYHIPFTRVPLTKHFANSHADVKDEIICAITDILSSEGNERVKVSALRFATQVSARASTRLFVGLPLCRNSEYLQLGDEFTINVFIFAQLLKMLPQSLHPIVGRLIASKCSKVVRRVKSHIEPLVEDYLEQKRLYGKIDNSDSGNILNWLVDEVQASQRTLDVEDLTRRILDINFAASGNTVATLADVLINLAAYPEHVAPMREEIEEIIGAEGWTKVSLAKMRKVDSFVKETLRFGTGSVTGNRRMEEEFTFSNGTSLPAGTYVSFATHPIHYDAKYYDNPTEFQGFRFSEMADKEGDDPKNQVVSLTPEFLIFGTGRHACPGRFLAAYVLKFALAHIVLNYDVEYPKGCHRPKQTWFQAVSVPDGTAELVFKKRAQMI